jgi:diacylglycerol O-acyltransferase-1
MTVQSIPERPSLLSAASGYENYRGFLNLLYVILAIGSFRLVLENILKYGLLVEFDWPLRFLKDPTNWPSVFLILLINLFILFQFWLEIKLNKIPIKNSLILFQIFNLSLLLIFPALYIYHRQPNPAGAFIAVGLYSIVFLKLVSYSHINYRCRHGLLEKKLEKKDSIIISKGPIIYPNNLTIKNLYYFIFAPTLCYELNFPRSPRIRKTFLCRRFGEILVICSLQYCLSQQWILPILRTLDRPLNQYSTLENTERILRLALPNHLIWLLLFYVYFHSTLNLLAELLCFGDRLFYRDWWNATDLYEFWNRWNTSVHDFCKRHVYNPLVHQCGFSKLIGSLVVFAISAFFHEYLISVPLRMLRPWSFLAMIIQVPIGLAVRRVKGENKTYGNIAVWISVILIQPIAILLYIQDLFYRDFVKQ